MGASGSGKSSMALRLMAMGADLVADDQVEVTAAAGGVTVAAPPGLPHMIEARGIGLLGAKLIPQASLVLIVDLDHPESQRLPPQRHRCIAGEQIALVQGRASGHLAAAVLQYLKMGREE